MPSPMKRMTFLALGFVVSGPAAGLAGEQADNKRVEPSPIRGAEAYFKAALRSACDIRLSSAGCFTPLYRGLHSLSAGF